MSHSFLLTHAKGVPADELERLRVAVEEAVTATASGQPFKLTLARDDFQRYFERCGGWKEWIYDVVNGLDFVTREPRYTGFISNGHILGKATADMLALALAKPLPVVVFEDGKLLPATRITQVEASLKDGWWIE